MLPFQQMIYLILGSFVWTVWAYGKTDKSSQTNQPPAKNLISPFSVCKKYQAVTRLDEQLKEPTPQKNLQKMLDLLLEQFPDLEKHLKSEFAKVIRLRPSANEYQSQLEELTLVVNNLFSKNIENGKIFTLWKSFPSSSSRAPTAKGKLRTCLKKPDPQFGAFQTGLINGLQTYFAKQPFFSSLLATLKTVPLFPSGDRVFFGATASQDKQGNPRICINPEEAPPALLPKLMHELVHAGNRKANDLRSQYLEQFKKWRSSNEEKEQLFDQMLDLEDILRTEAEVDLAQMAEDLLADNANKKTSLKDKIKALIGKKEAFKMDSKEKGLNLLTTAFEKWLTATQKNDQLYENATNARIKFDQERFIDEHRAYAVSLVSAWHLASRFPDQFCTLWVPSYQFKRPVPFPKLYARIEKHQKTSSLGKWIGAMYKRSYLQSAIYVGGDSSQGILPNLEKSARNSFDLFISEYKKTEQ